MHGISAQNAQAGTGPGVFLCLLPALRTYVNRRRVRLFL